MKIFRYMLKVLWSKRKCVFIKKIMLHQASIHLCGGIGNQLFMIASLLGYCKKNGLTPIYVKSETSLIRKGENIIEKFTQLQE